MKKNDLKRIQDIKKEIRKKHPGKFTHGKNLRAQEEKNKKRPSNKKR